MNQVVLEGRLVKDTEVRYTPGGHAVANFTLAVESRGKGDQKRTDWIAVVAWRELAERLSGEAKKGDRVLVLGSLRNRDWIDRQGAKREKTEVQAARALLVAANAKKPAAAAGRQPGDDDPEPEITDDDVPF